MSAVPHPTSRLSLGAAFQPTWERTRRDGHGCALAIGHTAAGAKPSDIWVEQADQVRAGREPPDGEHSATRYPGLKVAAKRQHTDECKEFSPL